MHGDKNNPDEAILIKDDYEKYYREHAQFITALSGDLISKTFLFIGFSFSDPNIDYILSRVRIDYGEQNNRQHYAIMRRVNEKDYNNRAEYEYAQRKHEFFIEDATYYKGETSESPDLTDTSTENIKKNLKDMMYDTSVTIVILSPNMKESKWIDWEIEYCLKDITRKDRTSHTNGVVAVIMKVDNSYEWFKKSGTNCHGSSTVSYELDKVFDIISQNHFNSNPEQWHCDKCKTYDWLNGSYITFVEEETFMDDPEKYINNAYDKSENDASGYDLVKQR